MFGLDSLFPEDFNHFHGFNQLYKPVTSKSIPQSRSSEPPILTSFLISNGTRLRLDSSLCKTVSPFPVIICGGTTSSKAGLWDDLRLSSLHSSTHAFNSKVLSILPLSSFFHLSPLSFLTYHCTRATQFTSVHQLFIEWLLYAIYQVGRHDPLRNWTRWGIIMIADLPASIIFLLLSHYCLLENFYCLRSKCPNIQGALRLAPDTLFSITSPHTLYHSPSEESAVRVWMYLCISWAYYILAYLHDMLFLYQEYPSRLKKLYSTFKLQHFVTFCSWPSPQLPPWSCRAPLTPCKNLH